MSGPAAGEPCRLALVLGTLAPGGFERQVQILATGLDRRSFEVSVIGLAAGGSWAALLGRSGVKVFELPRRGHRDWRRLFRLAGLLRTIRPHVVYSFTFENNAYARIAGLMASVPILVTGEGALYMSASQAVLERILLRFTECVICNSEAVRTDLVDRLGLPGDKLVTIRNGVTLVPTPDAQVREAARRALGAEQGGLVVGSVARLEEVKNIPMMIEVAARCREAGVTIRFVVVGGGSQESGLRAALEARGLTSSFALLGERATARDLLPGFDLFVLTSRSEGLPNAVLEAMVAGLPVVCTDVGGCRELVAHGQTGYIVPPGDVRGMTDRVLDLARDSSARLRMGRAGRHRCEQEFSTERFLAETGRLLSRLLAAKDRSLRGQRLATAAAHGAE